MSQKYNFSADSLPAKRDHSLARLKERPKPTTEEFHSELMEKFNSPNRSLQPASLRSLSNSTPETLPDWKTIFNEFQNTRNHRSNKKARQNEENGKCPENH